MESSFLQHLAERNGLTGQGFLWWEFRPGMGFGERAAWWREAERPRPHEGVDFVSFMTARGPGRVDSSFAVPAMATGEVVGIFADFLGRTVVLAHDAPAAGRRLYSLYGHTRPGSGLAPGRRVTAGEVIAQVADAPAARPPGPHLHLTLLRAPADLPVERLSWPELDDPAVELIDPLAVIRPYPPWFVYMVACADGSLYTGITTDLGRRVAEHNRGTGAKYTRSRRPVRLVWCEAAASRAAASSREWRLKRLPVAERRQMARAASDQGIF